MRYFFLAVFLVALLVLGMAGFRGGSSNNSPIELLNDMDHQDKVKYQRGSRFFADGVASRQMVKHTVPMGYSVPAKAASAGGTPALDGYPVGSSYLETGQYGDYFGHGIPGEIDVNEAFLQHGQQRYEVYCQVCHGESGNGLGVVSKHGLAGIADLHQLRLRDAAQTPDGSLYHTIVHGKGNMGPYGGSLNLEDRWSIVAYLRALQGSRKMPLEGEIKEAFEAQAKASGGEEPAQQ